MDKNTPDKETQVAPDGSVPSKDGVHDQEDKEHDDRTRYGDWQKAGRCIDF